jgi:hypothetical protein
MSQNYEYGIEQAKLQPILQHPGAQVNPAAEMG